PPADPEDNHGRQAMQPLRRTRHPLHGEPASRRRRPEGGGPRRTPPHAVLPLLRPAPRQRPVPLPAQDPLGWRGPGLVGPACVWSSGGGPARRAGTPCPDPNEAAEYRGAPVTPKKTLRDREREL